MFSITCNQIDLTFADGGSLWNGLSFTWSGQRLGIVGDNGSGKSSLLRLLRGDLSPTSGHLETRAPLLPLPQDHTPFLGQSLVEVAGLKPKIEALRRILEGGGSPNDLLTLDDDWEVEEDFRRQMELWRLGHLDMERPFESLSGGEQSRLLLMGLSLQQADAYVLDEPSNHLDQASRTALFEWMEREKAAIVVISHDRELLRHVDSILELSHSGARLYGGNFDVYWELREAERAQARADFEEGRKEMRKARAKAREALEKQQKRTTRSAKRNKARGVDKMTLNKLKGQGELSTAAIKRREAGRVAAKAAQFEQAKEALDYQEEWKIDGKALESERGRTLIEAVDLNHAFPEQPELWDSPLNFHLKGGQRSHLQGENGSGKSTLIHILLGRLQPSTGRVRNNCKAIAKLDQDLAFLDPGLSVIENFQAHFQKALAEHESRIRLGRFRFLGRAVFQPTAQLSGGERMRLALACLLATDSLPELLILDEPTNHLDLRSKAIFTRYLATYPGAMLLVSHDPELVADLAPLDQVISLDPPPSPIP